MGLLDQLAGQVLGQVLGGRGMAGGNAMAGGGTQNMLMQLVLSLLQSQGGLGGLLGRFQQAGLGDQAASWVSTGQNIPIGAEQVQATFGPEQIAQWARQLGLSNEQTSGVLAQMLPQMVDQLTPQGRVSEGAQFDDLLGQLTGNFFNR